MSNQSIRSRGTRSRRTIAMLTWTGLTIAAALLWYGRLNGTIRSVASETIVLLLSAFAGFSSIFAWMLFCPDRRSETESATLFFSGAFTLLPPCIIAFCLMPSDSPLRGWLTLGIFLLTVVAVMTPVPAEFFAVPRDRSTYLRPISESLFASLEVLDHPRGFEQLQLAAPFVTQRAMPRELDAEWQQRSGDPWQDPFRGTGIQPTRPGSKVKPAPSDRRKPPTLRDLHHPRTPATTPTRVEQNPLTDDSQSPDASPPSAMRPTASRTGLQRPAAAFGFQTPPANDTRATTADHKSGSESWGQTAHRNRATAEIAQTAAPQSAPADQNDSLTFERIEDEFGGVMVEGTVQIHFEIGQKRANVHVPFSPPLPGVPEVECESVGDDVLRLKVPVRQTYGIRIEARRSEASQPLQTEIGFAAVYSSPDR